jgi:hypothetical protein
MATLQTSGAISLNNIRSLFGGPASPSLANYYRGGGYIPSTKSVTNREPTSGAYYSDSRYAWQQPFVGNGDTGQALAVSIYWNGGQITLNGPANSTSYTSGGYTYYRSSLYTAAYTPPQYGGGGNITIYFYYIYRTSTGTVSINTSIPTSGTISLNQFYGAEKP